VWGGGGGGTWEEVGILFGASREEGYRWVLLALESSGSLWKKGPTLNRKTVSSKKAESGLITRKGTQEKTGMPRESKASGT